MDVKTGMIIMGEFALLGAVIWAYRQEPALIRMERRLQKGFRKWRRHVARKTENRRREKINRRAVYTPVKPPKRNAKEKAA